ncbi:MAG: hypothetical protein ACYDCK_04855 [Thermoplasmatota archaeon]
MAPYAHRLAFWVGYEREIGTLLIYAAGIAIYTMLVFAFYQNLSRREVIALPKLGGWKGRALALGKWLGVFPLMSFLYFVVLTGSLFVLAKSQSTFQITLLAMSVVLGVRVTAFVSENAAVDLAKMLPLGLLGVLVVDPSYMSLGTIWARVLEIPSLAPLLGRFFLLFIAMESALRVISAFARLARKTRPAGIAVPLEAVARK